MLEPNPWFSHHKSASEERDGLIRKLSSLENENESDEHKMSIFLQKAETLLNDNSGRPLAKYSLIETDLEKLNMLRSFSVVSGDVLSALAIDQLDSIRDRFRKVSLLVRKDAKGDFITDEDWKMIRQDDSDKSDE